MDESTDNLSSNQPEVEKPKMSFKETIKVNFTHSFVALIGALVITGVLLYGWASYFAWTNFQEAKRNAEEGQLKAEELRVLRQAQTIPQLEPGYVEILCPQKYINTQYNFEFDCPKTYSIFEAKSEGSINGWPNAVVLLNCASKLCQSYDLAIEIWSNENDFTTRNNKAPTRIEKNGDQYLTLWNVNDNETINQILSTFRFVEPKTTANKADVIAKLENWSLYQPSDAEVGTGDCGNKEFTDFLKKANSGSKFGYSINGLELVYTPNYNNWSNEKFVGFNKNEMKAVCDAGGIYPAHAYADKLLWLGVCSTGALPDDPKEQRAVYLCDDTRTIVDDYFGNK